MFNLKLVNLFLPEITKSSLDYKDVVVDDDNVGVGDDEISRESSPHHVDNVVDNDNDDCEGVEISREGSPHHVARVLGFPSRK